MSYYSRELDEIADELAIRDANDEYDDLVERIRSLTLSMDTEEINASFHSD